MPTYAYKARNSGGKIVRGSMEAVAREDLVSKLHKMGYMATEVEVAARGLNVDAWIKRMHSVRPDEKLMFYVELSSLIGSGMNLLTVLRTLE